jgi:hypothetical protein
VNERTEKHRSNRRKEGDMEQEGGPGGGVVCAKCGASFETQEELDRHVQETHPDEETQQES